MPLIFMFNSLGGIPGGIREKSLRISGGIR